MLNVALVGLLAGTLAIGGGDSKNPKAGDKPAPDNAVPGIFTPTATAPLTPAVSPDNVQDTYAFGIADRQSPVRFWASYAYGEVEQIYGPDGDADPTDVNNEVLIGGVRTGSRGDLVSQRGQVGAELGLPVGLFGFGFGVGGTISIAKNEFQLGGTAGDQGLLQIGTISSDFALQSARAYGTASAGPIRLHGGYVFDLGNEREFNDAITEGPLRGARTPRTLSNSVGRDAIFFGADFDYPVRFLRTFGAVDYYLLQGGGADNPNTAFNESEQDGDDIINAMFGAGVKVSFAEIGAALQVQTRIGQPLIEDIGTVTGIGGHAVTIAPYLRLSPPRFPASIFIKGAVQDQFTEYGYNLAGANAPKPSIGFTAGLAVGFH